MKVLTSIGAVLAGFVASVILSLAADVAAYAAWGVAPFSRPFTDPLFLLAIGYRAAFGMVAGWIAAKLSPAAPMRHAVGLGALGLIVGALGAVAAWDNPALGPRWYSVAVAAVSMPAAWAGGRLRETRRRP